MPDNPLNTPSEVPENDESIREGLADLLNMVEGQHQRLCPLIEKIEYGTGVVHYSVKNITGRDLFMG